MNETAFHSRPDTLITGESEMAFRIRALDWSRTPLGPIDTWSDTLLAQGMIKVPADPANLVIN